MQNLILVQVMLLYFFSFFLIINKKCRVEYVHLPQASYPPKIHIYQCIFDIFTKSHNYYRYLQKHLKLYEITLFSIGSSAYYQILSLWGHGASDPMLNPIPKSIHFLDYLNFGHSLIFSFGQYVGTYVTQHWLYAC